MIQLYDKNSIQENSALLEEWEQSAFHLLATKMTDREKPFPCIPAHQGFMLNHLRYAFLGDPRASATHKDLAALLKSYSECSRQTGKHASLIVFFKTPADLVQTHNIKDYERLFWSLLNGTSKLDEKEWPSHIPPNPAHHAWEFCFHQEQYFVYCATPGHVMRKSRSFPFFMLAITPRWVLEEFSAAVKTASKVKQSIRERLTAYDEVPPHSDLKWYGQSDNYEWKQYFLTDDDTSSSSCPFARYWKANQDNCP
ncbi:YqcI/YcgG family protein [Bacillus songklensis]|uniref:YqcI/YcgG family protein n=1 Tax=Bacillus songklensis TaxID=1069116 RepID=A0ABV8B2I5_9BACI